MGNKPLEEQEFHGLTPKSKPTFIREKNFTLFIICHKTVPEQCSEPVCHTVQIFRHFRHQDKESEF